MLRNTLWVQHSDFLIVHRCLWCRPQSETALTVWSDVCLAKRRANDGAPETQILGPDDDDDF